jgi:tripartite-type tricarboxylate transporter receptor subunit TctC
MKIRKLLTIVLFLTLIEDVLVSTNPKAAEIYPHQPIDLITGFTPGGQFDLINRILGKGLEKYLHVTVVPVNKPGAGEVIGATALVNSRADGYTLATLGDASLITSLLLGTATYSKEDLRVIGRFAFVSNVMVVSTDSPWKTIQEFMDYARKNLGTNYSHTGVGSSPHIRAEYFNNIANLKMRGVPFKGGPEVIAAVLGKHVQIGVTSYQGAKSQTDPGKMRILMCFDPPGLGPDPTLPNIPSLFGKNVPDIDPVSSYLVAPKKTPEPIIKLLEQTLEKITKDPEFVSSIKLLYVGIQFIDGNSVTSKMQETTLQIKTILQASGLIK